MANIQVHKIAACRFDYEYMGKSVSELERQYGFPAAAIEVEIEHEGWERKISPVEMPDTKNLVDYAEALVDISRSKLSIISIFRQIENQPLIAQLEKAILEKSLELVGFIAKEDDKAHSKLLNIVKAVAALQERQPLDLADMLKKQLGDSAGGNNGVIVNIQNNIQ